MRIEDTALLVDFFTNSSFVFYTYSQIRVLLTITIQFNIISYDKTSRINVISVNDFIKWTFIILESLWMNMLLTWLVINYYQLLLETSQSSFIEVISSKEIYIYWIHNLVGINKAYKIVTIFTK